MGFESIIRIYIRDRRPQLHKQLDWFANLPSLDKALEKAALAVDKCGKRFSHQHRLKPSALQKASCALKEQSCAIQGVSSFDILFELVDHTVRPISGLGELYIYDTSLRLGANLNLFPAKIYIHAGTRKGVRALGLDYRAASIDPMLLPQEFRNLEPYELEDVLCIFKDRLIDGRRVNLEGKRPVRCS